MTYNLSMVQYTFLSDRRHTVSASLIWQGWVSLWRVRTEKLFFLKPETSPLYFLDWSRPSLVELVESIGILSQENRLPSLDLFEWAWLEVSDSEIQESSSHQLSYYYTMTMRMARQLHLVHGSAAWLKHAIGSAFAYAGFILRKSTEKL